MARPPVPAARGGVAGATRRRGTSRPKRRTACGSCPRARTPPRDTPGGFKFRSEHPPV
jgi:hypothetical protein